MSPRIRTTRMAEKAPLCADPLASRHLVPLIAAELRPGAVAALNGRKLAQHCAGRSSRRRPDNARDVRLSHLPRRLRGARDTWFDCAKSCRVDRRARDGIELRTALGRWNVASAGVAGVPDA